MATTHPFNVVLVHGGFVDGSGWEGVYQILRRDGYNVSIVQNPTISLAGDVEAVKWVLAQQDRPVILVGHSYGGVVITEAGNNPKVAGLVYVGAFAPDVGESVETLIKDPVPGAPVPPLLPPRDGYLALDPVKFPDVVRRRRRPGKGRVHGGLAGAWGIGGDHRQDHQGRVEDEAELVSPDARRPDDSASCATPDGEARGRDPRRGDRESLGVPVASRRGRRVHPKAAESQKLKAAA